MITFRDYTFSKWHPNDKLDTPGDTGLGNFLFFIAGTIGIAIKNGYDYGFPEWEGRKYFVNQLPTIKEQNFKEIEIPWGFNGFDIPDNSSIFGFMQTEKYFEHCKELIRYYFTLKEYPNIYDDCIVMHYRNYNHSYFEKLRKDYYLQALSLMPDRQVIVITDNIKEAKKAIDMPFNYVSRSPIEDFYSLTRSNYVIMSNSTFSWWGAWLSNADKIIAPSKWLTKELPQSTDDIYCKNWIIC